MRLRLWDICLIIAAIPGLVIIFFIQMVDFSIWAVSEINVSVDTIYVSSVTLIGLATFGSVLGIKLGRDLKALKWNYIGIGIVSISVMMVIILQWFVMIQACCRDLDPSIFLALQAGTLFYLVGILVGFIIVLDPILNPKSGDSTTSS